MPNRWDQPALFLASGDPETENTPVLQYPGQLGARITIKQPPGGPSGPFPPTAAGTSQTAVSANAANRFKTYQLVQTDSSAAVAPFPNAVAWWSDKSKYLVTTSASKLGRGRVAGRFPGKSLNEGGSGQSITPGYYGCIQTHGPGVLKFINAPTSTPDDTGKYVTPSATDGAADCIAAGTASTYPILGYSAGTFDATNVQCLVDLDVPETV
jgi:hypothetical protein